MGKFDEFEVGQKHKFEVTVTKDKVEEFMRVTGDRNPIHHDKIFASDTRFGRPVCHGMLLASFFSTIVGMYLPGEGALYLTQELNFRKPVFVGDTVEVSGEIIKKQDAQRILTLKMSVKKDEILVVDGKAMVMTEIENSNT